MKIPNYLQALSNYLKSNLFIKKTDRSLTLVIKVIIWIFIIELSIKLIYPVIAIIATSLIVENLNMTREKKQRLTIAGVFIILIIGISSLFTHSPEISKVTTNTK